MSAVTAPSPHDPLYCEEFRSEVCHYFESLASCSSWPLNRNQGTMRRPNSLSRGFNLRAISDSLARDVQRILLFRKRHLPLPRKLWGYSLLDRKSLASFHMFSNSPFVRRTYNIDLLVIDGILLEPPLQDRLYESNGGRMLLLAAGKSRFETAMVVAPKSSGVSDKKPARFNPPLRSIDACSILWQDTGLLDISGLGGRTAPDSDRAWSNSPTCCLRSVRSQISWRG